MLLAIPSVLIGVALGYATGGRLRHLASVRLRALWLVWVSVGAQIGFAIAAIRFPSIRPVRMTVIVGSYVILAFWLVLNMRAQRGLLRVGVTLATVGWLLNLVVIIANGGMPVSQPERAGFRSDVKARHGYFLKEIPVRPGSYLTWLGNTVYIPGAETIVSPGDIALFLAIALIAKAGMHPKAHAWIPSH